MFNRSTLSFYVHILDRCNSLVPFSYCFILLPPLPQLAHDLQSLLLNLIKLFLLQQSIVVEPLPFLIGINTCHTLLQIQSFQDFP